MTANLKPKAWNLKPQMTAAPELWRGVVFLTPLWEGVGAPRALGGQSDFANSDATWALSDIGIISSHNDTSYTYTLKNDFANITQSDHTFGSRFKTTNSSSGRYAPLSAGDAVKWIQLVTEEVGGSFNIDATWDDDATKVVLSTSFNYSDGNWYSLFGRRLGSTYYMDLFDDFGVKRASTTGTVNNNFTIAAGGVKVGGSFWNTNEEFIGDIAWTFASDNYLSDAELSKLASDFAMLRPAGF